MLLFIDIQASGICRASSILQIAYMVTNTEFTPHLNIYHTKPESYLQDILKELIKHIINYNIQCIIGFDYSFILQDILIPTLDKNNLSQYIDLFTDIPFYDPLKSRSQYFSLPKICMNIDICLENSDHSQNNVRALIKLMEKRYELCVGLINVNLHYANFNDLHLLARQLNVPYCKFEKHKLVRCIVQEANKILSIDSSV